MYPAFSEDAKVCSIDCIAYWLSTIGISAYRDDHHLDVLWWSEEVEGNFPGSLIKCEFACTWVFGSSFNDPYLMISTDASTEDLSTRAKFIIRCMSFFECQRLEAEMDGDL